MDAIAFILVMSTCIAFLVWFVRMADWHSILAIAPYMLIIMAVMQLNYDTELTLAVKELGCGTEGSSSGWIFGCLWYDSTITYALDTNMLMLLNVIVMIGLILITFLGIEHTMLAHSKNKKKNQK